MTKANQKVDPEGLKESRLQQILYIYYLAQFDKFFIKVYINSNSKVNAIQQVLQRNSALAFVRPTLVPKKMTAVDIRLMCW